MFVVVLFNMSNIKFFYHTSFSLPDDKKTAEWLENVINHEKKNLFSLEYSFISKEEMIRINNKHLGHNYPTDVLSFDYSKNNDIYGEVFVCDAAVRSNAETLNESFFTETNRVLVHGLLHLCGHNDKSKEEQGQMRALEEKYLSLI